MSIKQNLTKAHDLAINANNCMPATKCEPKERTEQELYNMIVNPGQSNSSY